MRRRKGASDRPTQSCELCGIPVESGSILTDHRTGRTDANGRNWGDYGLVLCSHCGPSLAELPDGDAWAVIVGKVRAPWRTCRFTRGLPCPEAEVGVRLNDRALAEMAYYFGALARDDAGAFSPTEGAQYLAAARDWLANPESDPTVSFVRYARIYLMAAMRGHDHREARRMYALPNVDFAPDYLAGEVTARAVKDRAFERRFLSALPRGTVIGRIPA